MSKKQKNKSLWGTIITIILVAIVAYFGKDSVLNIAESRNVSAQPTSIENVQIITGDSCISKINLDEDVLRVYYFDVGQADSILIVNKGQSLLIDAGNNDDGELVLKNLKDIGISKLDYVIGTHPHEDHIGGLDTVINGMNVGKVMLPKTTTTTKTYEDVLDAISNKKLKINVPKVGDKFNVGDAKCEIMSISDNKENLNACSIVVRLEYDGVSYLFTGDAETENEKLRTWPKTNVLKAGHHGSSTSSSQAFLNQVSPDIIIISVGKDNKYGHPHKEILKRFEKICSSIYRTDTSGNILLQQNKK